MAEPQLTAEELAKRLRDLTIIKSVDRTFSPPPPPPPPTHIPIHPSHPLALALALALSLFRVSPPSVRITHNNHHSKPRTTQSVSATVIFLWDYLLTLGLEVEHIWAGRWTVVKAIFLIQRYIPFFDIMWFGMHVVLCFRVWAVWNRNKIMTVLLPILFASCWVPPIVFLVMFMKSVVCESEPFAYRSHALVFSRRLPPIGFSLTFENNKLISHPFTVTEIAPPFLGCVVVSADQIIALSWIFLVIWDARKWLWLDTFSPPLKLTDSLSSVILMLMLVPALKALQYSGHTALFRTVYGEGIIYYFYLFVISLVNLLLNRNTSIDVPYRFLAVAMLRSLHAVLTSRALLHIRAQIKRGQLHGLGSLQISAAQSTDLREYQVREGLE
ncbi:unnamed protein product [Cyclocybe aegerita]|uniref:DUF6533 domain-containing protein n=1 Tax=Cyclocybe aegerita TaxID=1973307 RepID=A0A8S0XZI4_CYCAE|nr:unnamed protein product [Cyclocybe aegerita]